MTKEELVNLWHQTQIGHYKKCRKKHLEFTDVMWKLYYKYNPELEDQGVL
jgi:hypothetical protein